MAQLEVKDCRWPWNRLYIHANGDVKPCCYGTVPIANVQDGQVDLDALWRGPAMTELRQYIVENRVHAACAGAGCAYVRSKVPTGSDFAGQARFAVPSDVETDENTRALASLGFKDALYRFALVLGEQKGQGAEYRLWLRRAAKKGSEWAAYSFGVHLTNMRRPIADELAAVAFQRAFDKGYAAAGTQLGILIQAGRLRGRRPETALPILKRAAEMGDANAWHRMALAAAFGNGMKQDLDEATRLLGLATRRFGPEERKAMLSTNIQVARTTIEGRATRQDIAAAFLLLDHAVEHDSQKARLLRLMYTSSGMKLRG